MYHNCTSINFVCIFKFFLFAIKLINNLQRENLVMKKMNILYYSLPIVCLVALMAVASFYDLQISKALADLDLGQYYSPNLFGRLFEVIGELPVYFLCGFSVCIFSVWIYLKTKQPQIVTQYKGKTKTVSSKQMDKKSKVRYIILACFLLVVTAFFYWIALFKMTGYILRIHNLATNVWLYLSQVLASGLLCYTSVSILLATKQQTLNTLVWFAIITLAVSALTNALVQGLKPIFSRLRYRAMCATYDSTFTGFTNWFQHNPNNTLTTAQINAGLSNDIFKSFPSGHTAGATSLLSLLSLPYLFKQNRVTKILLYVLCPLYIVVVAFSRIVMGAHFLSDVTMAILLGYICYLVILTFTMHIKYKYTLKQNTNL